MTKQCTDNYLDGAAGRPPPLLRGMVSTNIVRDCYYSQNNPFNPTYCHSMTDVLENPTSWRCLI